LLKTKRQNRRNIITVTVILALALAGLLMVNVGRVSADRASSTFAAQDSTVQASGAVSASDQVTDTGATGAIVKMIGALLLVILIAYGALWLMKRFMGRRYGHRPGGGALEVIESTYVGPQKTISLVRVGNRAVLVGVTDQQVSTLTELSEEETQEIMTCETVPVRRESFAQTLSSAAEKIKEFGLKRKLTALES
jgi:flagellar biosynthetic protein FliO